jgi:hypothetical protein
MALQDTQFFAARSLVEGLLDMFARDGYRGIERDPGKAQPVGDFLQDVHESSAIVVTTHTDVIESSIDGRGVYAVMLFVPGVGSVGVKAVPGSADAIETAVHAVQQMLHRRAVRADPPPCCLEADKVVTCVVCDGTTCRKCVVGQMVASGKDVFECPACGTGRDIHAIVAEHDCGVALMAFDTFSEAIADAMRRLCVGTTCVVLWRPGVQDGPKVTTMIAVFDGRRLTLKGADALTEDDVCVAGALLLVGDPAEYTGHAFLLGRDGVVEVEDMFAMMMLVVRKDATSHKGPRGTSV